MSHNFQILNNHNDLYPTEKQFSLFILIRRSDRSKPLNLFHLLYSCDCVSFFFSPFFSGDQQDKSNCLAAKKGWKGLHCELKFRLRRLILADVLKLAWNSTRGNRGILQCCIYKGPCELSKCLRSHYWQHFLPSKFSRGDLMASIGAWMQISSPAKWHEQSEKTQPLRWEAVHHWHN